MKFIRKILFFALFLACVHWVGTLVLEKQQLRNSIVRLHVVADSDEAQDQAVKLLVRDAVTEELEEILESIPNKEEAMAYLSGCLSHLEEIANGVLQTHGFSQRAVVSLVEEAFSTREYDTFTLPAGVYDALKITIGSGEGQNWWCVVFPGLCTPKAQETFADQAVGAGFSDDLTGALEQRQGYEVRFFFLDCLGWLENFFFRK